VVGSNGLGNTNVYALAFSNACLIAGTDGGVFYSNDYNNLNGTSWSVLSNDLTTTYVRSLAVSGTDLYIGVYYSSTTNGVFHCTYNNSIWSVESIGSPETQVHSLAVSGGYLFAGLSGVFRYEGGTSWSPSGPAPTGFMNTNIYSLALSGGYLFAGTGGGGVFRSANNGTSWEEVNTGLIASIVPSVFASGMNLFAGTQGGGVFHSTNNGTSWQAANTGLTNFMNTALVYAFAVSGMNLFAGTYGGVYRNDLNSSSISWEPVNNGLTNHFIDAFAVSSDGTYLFAGTQGAGGVFRYNLITNASWEPIINGLDNKYIKALAFFGTNLYAGTNDGGVFCCSNYSSPSPSWSVVNTGLTNLYVSSFAVSSDYIFVGTQGGGVFRLVNNATGWGPVGLTNTTVYALALSGTNLFAGTYSGVFRCGNYSSPSPGWVQHDIGLMHSYVVSLAVSGGQIFAGTIGGGVWRDSDLVASVNYRLTDEPKHFLLEQNFPNPFNPTTTISFTISSQSFVSLKIFDLAGREVATVVSEEMLAGSYSKQWNSANISSGIYFYRLQAGTFTETRKLVLLR
jgi:photosystem II stability/assembly factor-like uncharacterized protein